MEKKKNVTKNPKKKKIVPFDKIDITTATEDEIIKSGLKHNTNKDVICYLLITLIVVLAALPPILRIVMPRPVTKIEREIVYFTIKCYKTIGRDGYELSTKITSNYRDGNVNNVEFDYKYFKRNETAKDGYVFAEIEEFEKMNLKGVKNTTKEEGHSTFFVDFENNPELKDNESLADYTYFSTAEINYLTNEKGYSCVSDSETKMEVVDIETGKKVE